MDIAWLILLVIGAFAGGFINGLAGFGTSLFALPWWLLVLPPVQAVALVLAMSVASGIQGMMAIWHDINWRHLAIFLVPAFCGIPFGLAILHTIDAQSLSLLVALLLLSYGSFFSFKRELPNFTKPTPIIDGMIGFVSGVLGAVAGLSGALPTMWLGLRDWSKRQSRAILQPFNMTILGLSALLLLWRGAFTADVGWAMLVVLPVSIAAAKLGLMAFERMQDRTFRRFLIIAMLLSGIILLARLALTMELFK